MIFFTADTHFGHRAIIRYCDRPWQTADQMTEGLIERWNSKVADQDTVYHLGDVAMVSRGYLKAILWRLNGKICLVKGNHDQAIKGDFLKRFEWVKDLYTLKHEGHRFELCHYPLLTWNKAHHGAFHLHGHSHGSLRADSNTRLDVGVDCWDYYPISIEEVLEEMKKRAYVPCDHHGEKHES